MVSIATMLRRDRALVAVTVFQAVCGLYFLVDVLTELPALRDHVLHPALELAFVVALWFGSLMGARELWRLSGQNRRMEGRMRAASGAFLELIEESFSCWGLTRSERDVALLALKGLSISDIARLRDTREGTVKAQCAAVYRKAGVSGRAQLLSLSIEDRMAGIVLEPGRG
jgi:DNA-binding CsgD family transcriptional regulator